MTLIMKQKNLMIYGASPSILSKTIIKSYSLFHSALLRERAMGWGMGRFKGG